MKERECVEENDINLRDISLYQGYRLKIFINSIFVMKHLSLGITIFQNKKERERRKMIGLNLPFQPLSRRYVIFY